MDVKTGYISSVHAKDMLHGTVIRSPISHGKITSCDIPAFSPDVVVITAQDVPGSNALRVLQTTMPFLTQDSIQYLGQPLLAVFAPTYEQAKVCASSISIQFDTQPPEADQTGVFSDLSSSHGAVEEVFASADQIIERSYTCREQQSTFTAPTGAFAMLDGDKIMVTASTQWPFHVRGIISEVCAVGKRKVLVQTAEYSPNYGEKLIYPSIYGCLAALASLKSGKPARLISRFPMTSPRITVIRKSALNSDGDLTGEDVLITADIGAFPLFADEITEHLRGGAMGYIPADAYRIRVKTLYSPNPPRCHFDGFGFSAALFSSESQVSEICRATGANPAQWRLNRYYGKELRLLNHAVVPAPPLHELMDLVIRTSDFHRKYAACRMNQRQRNSHSVHAGYLRGIGIASGYAPNGFSRNYPWEKKYSVSVRLDQNNKITILTSLCSSGASYAWKKTCSEVLGITEDHISVFQSDTGNLPNSGPHILSRDIAVITPLIRRCCESIKKQRFKQPLPIEAKRGFKARQEGPEKGFHEFHPFSSVSWGAVVVELEVDSVSLMPEFRGIWCALDCGKIYDEQQMKKTLRTKLLRALHLTVGGRITADYMPRTDIQFIHREHPVPVSGTQVLVGLFYSAFCSALSQALNRNVTEIPLSPPEVLELLEEL